MKMQARLAALSLLAFVGAVEGARSRLRSSGGGAVADAEATVEAEMSAIHAAVDSMFEELAKGKGPAIKDILTKADQKISIPDAVRELDGKLPSDISSLVSMVADGGSDAAPKFSEASLSKALTFLNGMMFKGWEELDDVMFEAMEFEERNRGTYNQVVGDLSRLGSQLALLGEERVSASEGIASQDLQRKEMEETLEKTVQLFNAKRYENEAEMEIRRSDLAVFDFMLNLTACSSFPSAALLQAKAAPRMQLCSTSAGLDLKLGNPELQAKMEKLMTPKARLAFRDLLSQLAPKSLLQNQTNQTTATTSSFGVPATQVMPVQEEPHPDGQWKKCVDTPIGCGYLHDLMSLEWGKFRDSFDELAEEMQQNQEQHEDVMANINAQLSVINSEKTKFMEALARAISGINADTEELNEKEEQKRELTTEYEKETKIFKAKVADILFSKICAIRRVRNALMVFSVVSPPSNIVDCDFSDWVSKSGECFAPSGIAILCDDSCPQADPYKCGGKEEMRRDVVVLPNRYGMVCPAMSRLKKCGQKKCPVQCLMSEWSGWSKCTKDCESGIELKTRSILTKPKNGGTICDAVQEERSCNTGSCDRDCKLSEWSDWSFCSVACGGGFRKRKKKVLVPIRGNGKCPKARGPGRLQEDTCNSQDCVGDEICIAQQDLILAVDASGSLKQAGFETVRDFAYNLTLKYKPEYFGLGAIRIGVVLFGNGHLVAGTDGTTTITPAINAQPLTNDTELVRQKIKGLKYQKGFTNMAQALALADVMLSQGGRPGAQSAVMVLSDGKYSMKYQTAAKAQALKDKNVMLFMAPITTSEGKDLKVLKQWASSPWETNFERIPGLDALKYNANLFVQKLLVKFCPDAYSPSAGGEIDITKKYMMIRENGWPSDSCGKWILHPNKVESLGACAVVARNQRMQAFAYGKGPASGKCYSEAMTFDQAEYEAWLADRTHPPCPKGQWLYNPYFDTYAIDPSTV